MSRSERVPAKSNSRGLLARPLDALVFLLPLICFYEFGSMANRDRVIAFDLLRRVLELFGPVGMWIPGLLVVVILVATHIASGQSWSVGWGRVGWMYLEAVGLAVPLFVINWAMPQLAGGVSPESLIDRIAMGVGAGIYEELVFRLILISMILMVGVDLLRFDETTVAMAAVVLSSLIFAAHHHRPIGMEPFDATRFCFRAIAGLYLAMVFWYRGYGLSAGCHAAYNSALALLGAAEP